MTSLGESCSISDYIDRPICSQRVEGNPGQSTQGLGIAWLLLKGRSHIRLQGPTAPAGYYTLAGPDMLRAHATLGVAVLAEFVSSVNLVLTCA